MNKIKIIHTEIKDLDFACFLYNEAIKYQKSKGYPQYRWDDREMQKKHIQNKMHYKVLVDDNIAAVFNLLYDDAKVWREMEKGNSIYLHGVLINPKFKGRRMFGNILQWSVDHASQEKRKYIRLDTWYDNPDLVNYYKSFDFREVESFKIPDTEDSPLNCRGNKVCLMEYKIPVHQPG